MPDRQERLVRCFAVVFPTLTEEEILTATAGSVGIWDSLSTVTLAALIQEEFACEIDPEVLANLDSFASFRDYLLASDSAVR